MEEQTAAPQGDQNIVEQEVPNPAPAGAGNESQYLVHSVQPATVGTGATPPPLIAPEGPVQVVSTDPMEVEASSPQRASQKASRQFWQAGDLFPDSDEMDKVERPGLDHARLHPRFLHSNATSHKWALGAFVELLDNSMDEVEAGCSYVKVDKVDHPSEGVANPMLLVEDNGGGMDPNIIRNCMSFGFSMKKGKQMIGQYGNGFKTSTMRLGADALVLTKSKANGTCSVGLLSFTFLSATKSQDVVVPIIDYNLHERKRIFDNEDWQRKLSLICEWGPFESETEIWKQLDSMPSQGTRVYIWNLWQTSENIPELDFLTDEKDIRLQGGDEEVLESMTRKRRTDEGMRRCHSYRHSLRAYIGILYLKWPDNFNISIRGDNISRVPVSAGMKHIINYEYRPRQVHKEDQERTGPVVVGVKVGFAVEAPDTNVSGFCVYHRNRLIKPYWKVYSSASSVGRGVIGYLQVDFVEPAHDKQDFENTPPLQKLEKYLKRQVPHFWRNKAHLIGYQEGPHSTTVARAPRVSNVSNATSTAPVTPASQRGHNTRSTPSKVPVIREVMEEQITAQIVAEHHVKDAEDPEEARTGAGGIPDMETIEPSIGLNGGSGSAQRQAKQQSKAGNSSSLFKPPALPKDWSLARKDATYMVQMQKEVTTLQGNIQQFCNAHTVDDKAQVTLGEIFGRSLSKILDPAKEITKTCVVQMRILTSTLIYMSDLRSKGLLLEPIPEFLTSVMKSLEVPVEKPGKTAPSAPHNVENDDVGSQKALCAEDVTSSNPPPGSDPPNQGREDAMEGNPPDGVVADSEHHKIEDSAQASGVQSGSKEDVQMASPKKHGSSAHSSLPENGAARCDPTFVESPPQGQTQSRSDTPVVQEVAASGGKAVTPPGVMTGTNVGSSEGQGRSPLGHPPPVPSPMSLLANQAAVTQSGLNKTLVTSGSQPASRSKVGKGLAQIGRSLIADFLKTKPGGQEKSGTEDAGDEPDHPFTKLQEATESIVRGVDDESKDIASLQQPSEKSGGLEPGANSQGLTRELTLQGWSSGVKREAEQLSPEDPPSPKRQRQESNGCEDSIEFQGGGVNVGVPEMDLSRAGASGDGACEMDIDDFEVVKVDDVEENNQSHSGQGVLEMSGDQDVAEEGQRVVEHRNE
ncbi:hypothetical protein BSKO_08863 [Bryopsis sp. KO-2023]|nr:hypothetical protein BSKO_08863 [Bryopsis sp. KO-2023]